MKRIAITIVFLLAGLIVQAQDTKISADLDGDGKPDNFWIDGSKLKYQLSSQKNTTKSTGSLDIEGLNNSVTVTKNVVTLSMWAMRSGYSLKFRYDKAKGDFRIIGYDSENFGPASNDGSGTSSYNILTGQYIGKWNHYDLEKEKLVALPPVKKNVPPRKYYFLGLSDKIMEDIRSID